MIGQVRDLARALGFPCVVSFGQDVFGVSSRNSVVRVHQEETVLIISGRKTFLKGGYEMWRLVVLHRGELVRDVGMDEDDFILVYE